MMLPLPVQLYSQCLLPLKFVLLIFIAKTQCPTSTSIAFLQFLVSSLYLTLLSGKLTNPSYPAGLNFLGHLYTTHVNPESVFNDS